jgi:hypothetical protein
MISRRCWILVFQLAWEKLRDGLVGFKKGGDVPFMICLHPVPGYSCLAVLLDALSLVGFLSALSPSFALIMG